MFILLRRIERWLHQHIFKVGWLITQNYQTTTIFYYTIFLPGVILHELSYWLAAGMLNVRADRSIKWPEAQEVGELKLNFVQLNPKAHVMRKAIISIVPLLVGLLIIWYVAHNIFNITAVFNRMSSGNLYDVGAAFQMLIGAPLFWLWVYIIFTIANTMYPSIPKDLQGWRSVLLGLTAVGLALLLLGLGGEVFEALQTPLSDLIFVLQATFILMIGIDLLMVLVLGLIEYTIEHATGNSATFRGGKMITVTREEAIEEQRKQRELEQKEQAKKRIPAADIGLKSVYALPFSIPGIPPQEPVTLLKEHSQASIEVPAVAVPDEEEKKAASMPLFGGIAANAGEEVKPLSAEQKTQRESIAAKINMPERLGTPKPAEKAEPKEETEKPLTPTPAAKAEAPAEEKRQSSLFDKVGTSETEKAEDAKPAPSLGLFSKPAITTPKDEDDEAEDAGETEKPVASRFGGFSKPAITTPKDDDGEEEAEEKPVTSRFGGFSKPAITTLKDEDEAEDTGETEKPVASRFGGFSKPAITSPKDEEEAEEAGETEKPVASRFGGFSKPAITTPKDGDEAEEEAEEKPVASRFGGFSKPAITTPKDEDEAEDTGETEKPVASRFGGFSKPAITTPKEADEVEEEAEEKPVASRFGGFSKPAITTPKEDDEAEEAEEKPVASRFGGFSKPAITTPKEDDEAEEAEKPVASRFGGFSKPAITTPKDEDEVEEEEAKPATSRFSFSKPASEDDAKPTTSRFGSSPFKPVGEEEKPATSTSRFASTEFRRVESDEDEEEKPASRLGTSPFSKPSAFGTSRPAPKTFGKEEDENEDEDDEEVSRPASPILGRPSPFGSSRPAPKFGSKAEDDEDDGDEEEEAPRSRVSGFGLLGKRPKDEEIVYEDDEDDFRNFGDDDDDYVDSDDD